MLVSPQVVRTFSFERLLIPFTNDSGNGNGIQLRTLGTSLVDIGESYILQFTASHVWSRHRPLGETLGIHVHLEHVPQAVVFTKPFNHASIQSEETSD